jgi:hypothetical protein
VEIIREDYRESGVTVLSIGVSEPRQVVYNWRDTYSHTCPVLSDRTGSVYEPYRQGLVPLNAILDDTFTLRYLQFHFYENEIRTILDNLTHPLVLIAHDPLPNTESAGDPYSGVCRIQSGDDLVPEALTLNWRVNDGDVTTRQLSNIGGDFYEFAVPAQPVGSRVEYYLHAESVAGRTASHPHGAPAVLHGFEVVADEVPPVIVHEPVTRWREDRWSPEIRSDISDTLPLASVNLEFEINGGMTHSEPMTHVAGGTYIGRFDQTIFTGDVLAYRIVAEDSAVQTNRSVFPESGSIALAVIDPVPALVIDLDTASGSGELIFDSLLPILESVEFQKVIPQSLELYESVWVCLGAGVEEYALYFNQNLLLDAFLSVGGHLYLECGSGWYNMEQFNIFNRFGMVFDGGILLDIQDFLGVPESVTEGMAFEYAGNALVLNRFKARPDAEILLTHASGGFPVAAAHTDETSIRIGMGIDLGGLVDDSYPSTRTQLVQRYAGRMGLWDDPSQTCDTTGVSLTLSQLEFQPGDLFSLKAELCNAGTENLKNMAFFCLLEVGGGVWFYPGWTPEMDWQHFTSIDPGSTEVLVLPEFEWPDNAGWGFARIISALIDPETNTLVGVFADEGFEWRP